MTAGKNFLVTGAGRDIGRAIALALGGPGTLGVIHYANSAEGAESTLAGLRSLGGDGIAIQADLCDEHQVTQFLEDVAAALLGRQLDTLVLNAASTAATPMGDAPIDALKSMLAVNVLAPQRIVDGLSIHLSDGASIVAMSIAAVRQVFSPDFAFFSATKAAVDVLIKGWAVGLGSRGIRANAVAPGVVDVNFRADLLKDPGFRAALVGATALGRPGQIGDVADVVAFLASDKARWVTGQTIDASGGWKL